MAEAEKNPHTSALGKALYRDLSKEKKASPAQVQRNKERWAKRQAEREQGVAEVSAKPETLAKRAEWQKTPLTSNKIVIDGYTINFTPTALVISKGGKVLWKKEGNYSQPTNSTLAGAKKLVTGLSRQGQPDEKQMFGKVDSAELKARKEHRKKWQQASILSHEKKISFQQAWSQLFGGQDVEEGWDDEEDEVDKMVLVKSLKWPELVNKVNSAMKAMGWKGQRKDDGSFMFSTRGQLDDEWYIVCLLYTSPSPRDRG